MKTIKVEQNRPLVMIIDPTNHFAGINVSQQDILEACGFIPGWVLNDIDNVELNMKDMLETYYSWGMFEMDGSTVTKNGVHRYPHDPDLYPLIKITRGEETLYQYQYGIVAIVQKDGSSFTTRMD